MDEKVHGVTCMYNKKEDHGLKTARGSFYFLELSKKGIKEYENWR